MSGPGHNLLAQGYQSSPGAASDLKSKFPLSAPGHCTRLRATYTHVHAQLGEKKKVLGNFYLWGGSQPVVLGNQRICSLAPSSQPNNSRRPLFHFLEDPCRREFPLPITHGGKLHDALLYWCFLFLLWFLPVPHAHFLESAPKSTICTQALLLASAFQERKTKTFFFMLCSQPSPQVTAPGKHTHSLDKYLWRICCAWSLWWVNEVLSLWSS